MEAGAASISSEFPFKGPAWGISVSTTGLFLLGSPGPGWTQHDHSHSGVLYYCDEKGCHRKTFSDIKVRSLIYSTNDY